MKPRTWIFICILVLVLILLTSVYLVMKVNGKRTVSIGTVNSAIFKSRIYTVEITKFGFLPSELEISKGDSVIWKNKDSNVHYLVFDSLNITSPVKLIKDANFTYTFDDYGVYDYSELRYSYKKGMISVNF